MNYYERHLGDYARDTAHLSMIEHGAYSLLLDRYYATEDGIPADQAHRLARARTKEEKIAVDSVLAEFFVLVDGIWRNRRADEEIEKANQKIEVARANGTRGGRPKKNRNETKEKPSGFPDETEIESQTKALQTPDTRYQIPEKKKALPRRARLPDDFVISDRVKRWAQAKGYDRLQEHFDYFVGYAKAKGAVYLDWDEAFMNAIRGNWAKLRDVPHETHQRIDNSAVARVHRATAAILEREGNGEAVADHDGNVWAQVGERVR